MKSCEYEIYSFYRRIKLKNQKKVKTRTREIFR